MEYIYNLCTEHEAVDEIRHVQYGMVFTLVAIVLLLNLFATSRPTKPTVHTPPKALTKR